MPHSGLTGDANRNFAGTFLAGAIHGKYFRPTTYAIPLAFTVVAVLRLLNSGRRA